MIRVGQIGLGAWGGKILRTLSEDLRGEAEVRWTAGRHDWPSKLSKNDVDAVVIAVPPDAQPMIAKTVLEAGLSVFLEKPFALDSLSARQIHDAAAMRGLPVLINHVRIFDANFEELKRRVRDADFGYLESWGGGNGPYRTWAVPHPGLWDWGPHDVAMVLELLDGATIDRVAAKETALGCYHLRLYCGRIAGDGNAFISTGNGFEKRTRALHALVADKSWTLDDDGLHDIDGQLVLDRTPPLTRALKVWLAAVRGSEWDDRVGTGLALQVVSVLEQAQEQLTKGPT